MKSINNLIPLISGFEYSWANLTVFLANGTVPVVNITSIKYSQEQDMEDLYGAGNFPVARTNGNFKTTASITLRKSELIGLQAAARTSTNPLITSYGEIQSILPFKIVVQYKRDDYSSITVDELMNCQFLSNSVDLSQGDMSVDVEVNLICSHIKWGTI